MRSESHRIIHCSHNHSRRSTISRNISENNICRRLEYKFVIIFRSIVPNYNSINYSIKTQYLSKINKGLGKNDDVAVNEFTPDDERPIPFKRMIYFGDGMTDIPSMKLTKDRGGNAVAVYDQSSTSKNKALRLLVDNRVNFALHADYRENKELDRVVKTILDRIATERDLDLLKAREEKKKQLLSKKA